MYPRTYLILIALHETMDRTYQKEDKRISQHSNLPTPEGREIYRIESSQFCKWPVEQFHVVVKVRMPQKEPVRKTPANNSSKETTYIERLEVECSDK